MSDEQTSDQTQNDTNDTNDESQYMYVSRKHYYRKKQVEDGQVSGMIGTLQNMGPIGGLLIVIFDIAAGFIARFIVTIIRIAVYAFDWVMGLVFGNYSGLLPSAGKTGSMYTMKFMRYIIMVLYPPLGVFVNKGIYGWFNIFITFLLCYVHYAIGIIYTFIICSRNRYADLYERAEIKRYNIANPPSEIPGDKNDYTALLSVATTFIIIITLIFCFIKFV
jgi:uncharacterized membrane protein YqaE (UPF0057 family)